MQKFAIAVLAIVLIPVHAAWVPVWSEGGSVYYDNATVRYSGPVSSGNPFLRAWIYTSYLNSVNSSAVCYPAAGDCQWKRLNTLVLYDWDCRNTVRLLAEDTEWDSGPTSQSYDRYQSPEPRPLVAKPGPTAAGSTFNIANDPSLMAVRAAVCRHWPK